MIKKAFSLAVGACFLLTQLVPSYAQAVVTPSPSAPGIPQEIGKVTSHFQGTSGETVYYIQDAHLNQTAQLNIARLIEYLKAQEGIVSVGLEGVTGPYEVEEFQSLPFPELKEKIFQDLLKKRKITGPEYSAYIQGKPGEFYGVDDGDLYIQNVRAFVESHSWRESFLRDIQILQIDLENIKTVLFNKELKAFDERLKDLFEGQKNYQDALSYLLMTARTQKIPLASYPVLTRYQGFSSQKKQTPETFPLLDAHEWMKEIQLLVAQVKRSLYQDPDETLLDEMTEKLRLLKDFFRLQMLPEEFHSYEQDPASYRLEEIQKTLRSFAGKARVDFRSLEEHSFNLPQAMKDLAQFYDLAHARDQVLVENQLEWMRSQNFRKGILIAGGFHNQGIQKELKKRGVSYYVIQPQMTVDFDDLKVYEDIMGSYERFFKEPPSRSSVIPLSNLKPIRSNALDTSESVRQFWTDEIYQPYLQAVQETNTGSPYSVRVARNGVLGEVSVPVLLASVMDSDMELGRLNRHMIQAGTLREITDPAYLAAEGKIRAASLGEKDAVKVMLIYLTDHIHEGKIYEPLGIETLSAYLERTFSSPKENIKVNVTLVHNQIDQTVDAIMEKIRKERPKIIGVSLWFGTLKTAQELYKRILREIPEKDRPEIILGNTLATYNEEKLLEDQYFPTAILNIKEGELSLVGLVRHVADPEHYPLKDIPNIVYKNRPEKKTKKSRRDSTRVLVPLTLKEVTEPKGNADIVKTQHEILDLTTLGLPNRVFMDDCIAQGNNVNMEASRGCTSHCAYCSQANTKFRTKPMDTLMDELVELSRRQAKKVNIVDDVFLGGNLDLMDEFARRVLQLKKEGKIDENMVFYTTARARDIWNPNGTPEDNQRRKEIYKNLRIAGFMTFNIGIESGADTQLRRYGKGIPVSVNENALQVLKEIAEETKQPVEPEAGFIPFDPATTLEELVQNLDFLERTGLKYTISYPFQQMRIQEGTSYVIMTSRWGLIHERDYDPNWLVYNYHYRHPEVARIVYHLKHWEPSVFRFFYAFKQLMRAMPVAGSTPEEHAHLTNFYRDIHRIQVDLLKGLVDAEKRVDPKLTVEKARTASLDQMNTDLRKFYFTFLDFLRLGIIRTDKEIFQKLIYISLVKNVITYPGLDAEEKSLGWDQGKPFSIQEVIDRLQPSVDLNVHLDTVEHRENIIRALNGLADEKELIRDRKGESSHFTVTGEFFNLERIMQKVDLPKGAKPAGSFEYDPNRGRSINVIFAGAPFSGRSTAAKRIKRDYKIPRISIRDLIKEAEKNPDIKKQYAKAREAKERYPYPFIRDLLWNELKRLDQKDKLNSGFVLEASLYLDQLYQDVFRRLGIDIDYVLFLDPDKEQRSVYMKEYIKNEGLSRKEGEQVIEINNQWIKDHEKDLQDLFRYFYQKGKAIKVPLDKNHPNAAVEVFGALNTHFSYVLRPEDVSPETYFGIRPSQDPAVQPEEMKRLDVLSEILKGDHEGLRNAFEQFKSCCVNENFRKDGIHNPPDHPKARVSDNILRLIMIQANQAKPEERVEWVKFIFGVEPVRMALKNGWLPGFTLFLLKASNSESPHHDEVLRILEARMGAEWPVSPEIFKEHRNKIQLASSLISSEKYHRSIVSKLMDDKRTSFFSRFGQARQRKMSNESVMMFKPGVELTPETMTEILNRLGFYGYEVIAFKKADGKTLKESGIIHRQYEVTSKLAHRGAKDFTSGDFTALQKIYGRPEFQQYFGLPAEKAKIYGAYEVMDQFGLTPEEVTELWSGGYDSEKPSPVKKIRPQKEKLENPPRVLIVDNRPLFSQPLADLLEELGMEVEIVLTEENAVHRIHGAPFDMIFSDINLADINLSKQPGKPSFLREFLESDHPKVPLVLMGDKNSLTLPPVQDLIASDDDITFMTNPFGMEDVASILKTHLPDLDLEHKEIITTALHGIDVGLPPAERLKALLKKGHHPIFRKGYIDGINRIGDRIYVMPVRHPKVNNNEPFFMVDGHFIHVSQMYEAPDAKTYIFLVRSVDLTGSPASQTWSQIPTDVQWKRMRQELIGETDPQAASPGTVRNDLFKGVLPVKKGKVDIRNNGVHYSESAMEALKEILLWFPEMKEKDTNLGRALFQAGYSKEEIQYFLSDPSLKWGDEREPLFKLISMMDLDDTIEFLLQNFPPYYPQLDKSRGRPTVSFTEFQEILEKYNNKELGLGTNLVAKERLQSADLKSKPDLVISVAQVNPQKRQRHYLRGIELLKKHKIARVLSTAGNTGRLLGYDKPEKDRIRALAELVVLETVPGKREKLNAFQVQEMINGAFKKQLGVSIPTWYMASDLNAGTIDAYFSENDFFKSSERDRSRHIYESIGIPRLNPNREDLGMNEENAKRSIYENGGEGGIFKWAPNELSTKTPGHLDVIASLVLSGQLKTLVGQGYEMIDVGDAANLGTLGDPEIYGQADEMMEENPQIGMVPVLAEPNMTYEGVLDSLHTGVAASVPFKIATRGEKVLFSNLPQDWTVVLEEDGHLKFYFREKLVEDSKAPIRYEIKPEAGGGLLTLDNQVQIVESLRIPSDFKKSEIRHFFTFRSLIRVDAILKFYGLTREEYFEISQEELAKKMAAAHKKLPLYVEIKDTPHEITGQKRKVAQVVRLYGDLSSQIPSRYLLIDRDGETTLSGYAGYKEPNDIEKNQTAVERIVGQLSHLTPTRNPKVSEEDLKTNAQGQSLGREAQQALSQLIQDNSIPIHSTLMVPTEAELKNLDAELLKQMLRNPNHHLSLYLPGKLMDQVPEKWKRKNLDLVNADQVPLLQHLDRAKGSYSRTALIGPETALTGEARAYKGYRLATDRLMGESGISSNDSGKSLNTFLTTVSFGLAANGDLYRSRYLKEELSYDPTAKVYYVNKKFALGRLLEEWMDVFQGLMAIKKAA